MVNGGLGMANSISSTTLTFMLASSIALRSDAVPEPGVFATMNIHPPAGEPVAITSPSEINRTVRRIPPLLQCAPIHFVKPQIQCIYCTPSPAPCARRVAAAGSRPRRDAAVPLHPHLQGVRRDAPFDAV